jgi:hypothetical protein
MSRNAKYSASSIKSVNYEEEYTNIPHKRSRRILNFKKSHLWTETISTGKGFVHHFDAQIAFSSEIETGICPSCDFLPNHREPQGD